MRGGGGEYIITDDKGYLIIPDNLKFTEITIPKEDITDEAVKKRKTTTIESMITQIKEIIDSEVEKISYIEIKYESNKISHDIDADILSLNTYLTEIIEREEFLKIFYYKNNNTEFVVNKFKDFYEETISEKRPIPPNFYFELYVRNTYEPNTFNYLKEKIKKLINKLKNIKAPSTIMGIMSRLIRM
jgi:hypothetical protein